MNNSFVSKKTILFLLVLTILISIFSTTIILKKFTYSQQPKQEIPLVSKTEGTVQLTITEEPKPKEPSKLTGEVRLTII